MKWRSRFLAIVSLVVLAGCGGGGGGGGGGFALNGSPVGGSVSMASASTATKTYSFDTVADHTYTVWASGNTGDAVVTVMDANGTFLGWGFIGTTQHAYSFIATATTGKVTVTVQDGNFSGAGSTYTLQAYDGHIGIGGSRTASTNNDSIYFDFDAVGGTAYRVQLTPRSGDVDIGAVNAKLTASVGSSTLPGAATDTVAFLAPATQRYYVRVDPKSVDSTFDVKVDTTTSDPDLIVAINSAASNGTNVAISYTVRNAGLTAVGGNFGVTGWTNRTSAPTVGDVGQASADHTGGLAVGATVSGTLVIPDSGNSGTAYLIVDTANAVVEASETNNVSAAKAWSKPLLAPQSLTFEDSLIPAAMSMSGNADWAIDAGTGSASSHSLRAGAIGNSQTSCVTMAGANATSIQFDYAVSSEQSYDFLQFYIDGVQQSSYSGSVVWSTSPAYTVTAGVHDYKWCYSKDFTTVAGSDTAWIDNIQLQPATVDLQVVVNSAVSNGTNVVVNYTVSNSGNTASGPFAVDVWSNAATTPVVGATGQGSSSHTSLAAGATVTGSVTVADAAAGGTAYAVVDTANTVVETNEANNVSPGTAWTPPPPAPLTLNFDDGLVPTVMTMSGNAGWATAAGGAGGSAFSLRAGSIADSQQTCVSMNVANSSSASFSYSVSSEASWDFLYFYIDGALTGAWSGAVSWTTSPLYSAGTTGTHEYKWCYIKDSSYFSGSDTAWIDDVVIN